VRRLLTIPISHFCEKARWSLERAGLDYTEEHHVQGVHRIVSRRAGGGGTLPVLVAEEGVFAESEDILRYADERTDEGRRLFPAGAGETDEVVRSQRPTRHATGVIACDTCASTRLPGTRSCSAPPPSTRSPG
jgi:glutathione S-transferase